MATVTDYPGCTDCCGGATVDTDCCAGVPETLFGTITAKTGDCTCLPDNLTFTYGGVVGGHHTWYADTFATCDESETCDWNLVCPTGSSDCTGWTLGTGNAACLDVATNVTCSCSPFEVEFLVELAGGGSVCTGDATLTITD
jgi:hypothetical protein